MANAAVGDLSFTASGFATFASNVGTYGGVLSSVGDMLINAKDSVRFENNSATQVRIPAKPGSVHL